MTMLSPLGRVPKQRPPRSRRSRRVLPAAIMMVALLTLAGITWWRVLHRNDSTEKNAASSCIVPTAKGLSINPRTIKVRVYNATDQVGLAKTVSDGLHRRGYVIASTANDPLADVRKVDGAGELRYGPKGADQALLLSLQFPAMRFQVDERGDAIVDVAVGPKFTALASNSALQKAKAEVAGKAKSKTSVCGA